MTRFVTGVVLVGCAAPLVCGTACLGGWEEGWSPIAGHLAEGVVGPAGGTVEVAQYGGPLAGTRVDIPPGALTADVTITIDEPTDSQRVVVPLFSEDQALAILGPIGLTFEQPVRITVPYPASLDGDEVGLIGIDYENDDAFWVRPAGVDQTARMVTAESIHFSGYLAQRYGGPAYFEQLIWRSSEGGFAYRLASVLGPDEIGLALHDVFTYGQPTLGAVLDGALGVGFVFVFEVHLMEKDGGWAWFDREVAARKVVYELEFAMEDLSWPRVGYRVRVHMLEIEQGLGDSQHVEVVTDGAVFASDLEALLQNRAVVLSTEEQVDPEREYYLRGEHRVGDNWAPGLGNPIVLSNVSWESTPVRGSELPLLQLDDNADGVVDEYAWMFLAGPGDDDDATSFPDDDDTAADDDDFVPDDDDFVPDDDDTAPDDDDSPGPDDDDTTPSATYEWVAVATGVTHSCGLEASGQVTCWGQNDWGQTNPQSDLYVSISSGGGHNCGLRADGSIGCWGRSTWGQSGGATGSFVEAEVGQYFSCGLRSSDGSILCWGSSSNGETSVPSGAFSALSGGGGFGCGIRTPSEALDCWGNNSSGQTNSPPGTFIHVGAGSSAGCAVAQDGSIATWGNDAGWALPSGDFVAVECGTDFGCGLDSAGGLSCWGDNGYGRATPPAGTFEQFDCAAFHCCALGTTGEISCWGNNNYSQTDVPE